MQFVFDVTALVVAMSILFAAWMWALEWKQKCPLPIWDLARIFAIAFTIQLCIYSIFSFVLVDIRLRVYLVRTSIIVICLSQAIPLWIAFKTWKGCDEQ